MKKQKIHFSFIYPVTEIVQDFNEAGPGTVTHIAELVINGTGYKYFNGEDDQNIRAFYEYEISEILFENKDILNLLPALHAKEDIHFACLERIEHLFKEEVPDVEPLILKKNWRAKIIQLPLCLIAK